MMGINIDDLTIEQYLRLTSENQTLSMVKNVDDVTINEYMEYEERMKRQYSRFSYDSEDMELDKEVEYTTDEESVTSKHKALDPAHADDARFLKEELSSEEDLDEWLKVEMEKYMNMEDAINDDNLTSNLPNQSPLVELNPGGFLLPFTIGIYSSYAMANIDASNNAMPRSICTVKNALVKIDKFEFSCDFVVTDMPENLGEMIILGIPFFETIHAQIDDHERRTVKGSCMGFADFIKIRYENQRIDDTTRERRYYEWVSQNYEFDNNMTLLTTTMFDKCPYKTNYPTPVPIDEWDTRGQSLICITKHDDDALPLGRVNGARFKAMIRKELKDKGLLEGKQKSSGGIFDTIKYLILFSVKCKYVTRNTGKGRKNKENTDSYEVLRRNTYDSVTPIFKKKLLAKKDEAGITLSDEHNDFLLADASEVEEFEDLNATICMMSRIQQ
ncbi:hypothetical protein Tco_1273630 [Tanacetum coccineum]